MSRSPGRDVVHQPIADEDFAAGGFFQAGDHPQRGRLAATAGADEDHELAVGDLEIDIANGVKAVRVFLIEMFQQDIGHVAL